MTAPFPGTAADLSDEFVLRKCDYFTTVHLWPLRKELTRLWLENFEDHGAPVCPLSPQRLRVHRGSHRRTGSDLDLSVADAPRGRSRLDDSASVVTRWHQFVDSVIVVPVSGEHPGPTDSGYSFARLARDRLGISERRILDAPDAIKGAGHRRLLDAGRIPRRLRRIRSSVDSTAGNVLTTRVHHQEREAFAISSQRGSVRTSTVRLWRPRTAPLAFVTVVRA